MKTICEYRVAVKHPKQNDGGNSSTATIATAYHGTRCIGRFSGIHAKEQAEALIVLAQAGATEASLSLCAADIEFSEISGCM
jgi:hypothetical protein